MISITCFFVLPLPHGYAFHSSLSSASPKHRFCIQKIQYCARYRFYANHCPKLQYTLNKNKKINCAVCQKSIIPIAKNEQIRQNTIVNYGLCLRSDSLFVQTVDFDRIVTKTAYFLSEFYCFSHRISYIIVITDDC